MIESSLVSDHADVVIQFRQRAAVVISCDGRRVKGRVQVADSGSVIAASDDAHEEIVLALISQLRRQIALPEPLRSYASKLKRLPFGLVQPVLACGCAAKSGRAEAPSSAAEKNNFLIAHFSFAGWFLVVN
jgi:hypothetical protein